jgi:predicted flap endonuclease-1-like 5' DNA nuclease
VEKLIAKKLGYATNPEGLKVVEGIGPKIDGLLKEAGIKNWSDLAAATEDRLREILAAAGDRYRLADPSSWPQQAGLAAAGKWDELKQYQDFLSGGKDPGKA